MVINISITDKRPAVDGAPVIVCNNKVGYTIQFTFDAEWNGYSKKVVRFVWIQKGEVKFRDVEMTGTTCTVPALSQTDKVRVGVFAGDICTTTPAIIPCERSILCEDGTPSTENDGHYANEARASADRAEAAADRAASDATAAAEAEVEQLVGELGVVQETGVSLTSVMAQGASSRSFANAIKGEESGGAVLCEEVSPVLHPVVVGVRSRNALPETSIVFGKYWETDANGTVYQQPLVGAICASEPLMVEPNNTYCVSSKQDGTPLAWAVWFVDENYVSVGRTEGWKPSGGTFTVPSNCRYALFTCLNYGESYQNDIMINKGTTAEPYSPSVPTGTSVKVTGCGRNLIPFPYMGNYGTGFTTTVNGTTFTVQANQGVKIKGTPTADTYFNLMGAVDLGASNINAITTDNATNGMYCLSKRLFYNANAKDINIVVLIGETIDETIYPMLNRGSTAIPHEPYEGQTIDTAVGSTIDLPSVAPYMSVYPDNPNTAVDVTYVKDTNAVVQKLVNAIVALGGNV